MGKKYIIELEDGEHPYKTTINAFGTPVLRAAEKIPYTEPDLERIRKEAYDKGFDDGRSKCSPREYCMNESYQQGLDDA